MPCAALSLKENMTIFCMVSPQAVDTYYTNVISIRAVVFVASCSPPAFIHCAVIAQMQKKKETVCGCYAVTMYAQACADGAAVILRTR